MKHQHWRKLDGTKLKRPIDEEVRAVLVREKEMGHELKVCIGTDSEVKCKETGEFMYIRNEVTDQKMSIKQRMLTEVAKVLK